MHEVRRGARDLSASPFLSVIINCASSIARYVGVVRLDTNKNADGRSHLR